MLISVLIVSHNNQKDLELLLPSLKLALNYLYKRLQTSSKIDNKSIVSRINKGVVLESSINNIYEILLVDNCSSDLTIDFVQKNFPDIVITKNKKKMGYGANQNKNIAKANGEFILVMNPDMVIPIHTFSTMIDFMESHQDAGITTCKICNVDGSCQYLNKREPAIFDLIIRRLFPKIRAIDSKKFNYIGKKIHTIIIKRLNLYEMIDLGYDKVVEVPFISGSFMFARRSIIKEVNGFDERFFIYFEDIDLCKRVRVKASTLYCPDVSVIHRWERASHKSLKWTFVFILSGLKYFHKWGFRLF